MNPASLKERIYVALDVNTRERALQVVRAVSPVLSSFKVGMELFYFFGPDILRELRAAGAQRIFLDLKLHDIPNTVARAAAVLTKSGVDMMTVHASGGSRMMETVLRAVADQAAAEGIPRPRVVAVTQLTSTDQKMLNEELGIPGSMTEVVQQYARLAQQSGLDGVVASAEEVPLIREVCGPDFLTVVPGIRPAFYQADGDDQRRVATPRQALERGAGCLVIGRPILRSPDWREAAEAVLAECAEGSRL
ncbi:orotidine-5'-phosphate decarboxylase [Kyrpidia spormannii]|uniref:Orotidine 5'-phosphate decarboxylase n=1 Tax=Kyrpidia spormannii TaxID=2055160 RepID=A0A6F9EBM7_9BACL|nr:orotidine-5'-phosphate decarboxylase [Kyrpidia spormannii]CAB3393696.1 orotidine 5'-phosphate decarboxylase [Kyrpidia spormannii]